MDLQSRSIRLWLMFLRPLIALEQLYDARDDRFAIFGHTPRSLETKFGKLLMYIAFSPSIIAVVGWKEVRAVLEFDAGDGFLVREMR